ncbi:MAG: hypothetical protein QOK05_1516 [Chloroflexota bacterium]|nr:hypothetical protein [Chloroflexota bacterium]
MRVRPTRRLPGLLFAALTFYIFATNSQVIWLYLVAALMAALVVVGTIAPLIVVRRARPRLARFSRTGFVPPLTQDRGRIFAGDLLVLVYEMGETQPPVELGPLLAKSGRTIAAGSRVAGTEAIVELDAGARGAIDLDAVRVASSWPLGVVRAERWVRAEFSAVVHPRYALPPDDRRHGTLEPVGAAAVRGPGDEFLGLREYRSGDSQRRIHWPTSARTGTLMVIETAQESSNSTHYELALAAADAPATELAVGLAASLAAGNVVAGVPMGMSIPGQARVLRRWGDVLDALAVAFPGEPAAASRSRDSIKVKAEGAQVMVNRGDSTQVLDGGLDLAEALAAIQEAP